MHTEQAEEADDSLDQAIAATESGRHSDAMAAAGVAVAAYRALADAEPEVFRPDLAAALGVLADALAGMGRHPEARDAALEAVALFRALAEPDVVGSDGAESPAATSPAAKSEAATSQAATTDGDSPALFLPYLAAALSNLSVRLHATGDDAAAREAAEEAVTRYAALTGFHRTTADRDDELLTTGPGAALLSPDERLLPYLAVALSNLAHRLDDLGRVDEALLPAADATRLYQQLAAADAQAHQPGLAQAINNQAVLLRQAGKGPVAIATTRQAVNLYRSLAAADPESYLELLATAVDNLANMLSDAGRDALSAARETVELYRTLAERDDRFRASLAASLNNLAVRLAGAGKPDEARPATEEAAALYRRLARNDPNAHLSNLAGTLANLASDRAAAGLVTEALQAAREAVDVTRRLAFGNRPEYLPQLAQAVNNLAVRLHEAGRDASAMASAREAVRLYEELGHEPGVTRSREFAAFLDSDFLDSDRS